MATGGSRKWAVLALHLAAGMHVADAAREAHTSERTAHRLLRKPGFVKVVRRIQAQMRTRVVGRLADASTAAVATLVELLSPDSPATARLGAARAILEHTGRMTETVELEQRIAALETEREKSGVKEYHS